MPRVRLCPACSARSKGKADDVGRCGNVRLPRNQARRRRCHAQRPPCRAVVNFDTERVRSSVQFAKSGLHRLFLQDIFLLACGMRNDPRHAQDPIAQPRYRLRTGTPVRQRCRDRARGPFASSTRGTILRSFRGTFDFDGAIGQRPLIRSAGYGARRASPARIRHTVADGRDSFHSRKFISVGDL